MRHFFTSLLLLAAVITAHAQFSATKIIDQCRPCNPKDVQSADFDNDGDIDLLITGFIKGEVAIARNEGNGVFSAPEIIMEGDFYLHAAYPGDLNNDGWIDIVYAGENGVSVGFIRNDGTGGFGNYQQLSTSITEARDVHTADIDADGWLDILVASSMTDRVYWFRNQAGLGFSNQMLVAVNMVSTLGLTTGDIDGDGDVDVFIPADAAAIISLTWARNDGEGNFNIVSFPIPATVAYQVTGWELGDMDNDGDLDVVTTTLVDSRLRWHRNDGDGNFSTPININCPSLFLPQGLDLADLDNDGDLEIMVASGNSDQVFALANNGDGTFALPLVLSNDANYVRTVHAAELNGDGLMDVVSVSSNDDEVTVYQNEGALDFTTLFVHNPPTAGLQLAITADLTGDDRQDLLAYADGDPAFVYFPLLPDGTFGEARTIDFIEVAALTTTDMDGNGYNDLVLVDYDDSDVFWYPNQGGQFSARQFIGSAPFVPEGSNEALAAQDMDGDGDTDLLGVYTFTQEIFYYENLGNGDFADPLVLLEMPLDYETVSYVIKDWDLDGRPTLYLSLERAEKVIALTHDGMGGFVEEVLFLGIPEVSDIGVLDANADTYLDLVISTAGDLIIYYGDNSGGYDPNPETLTSELNVHSLQIADLDNNGSDDIGLIVQEDDTSVDGSLYAIYTTVEGTVTVPIALTTYTIPGTNSNFREKSFLTDVEHDNDFDFFFYSKDYTFLGWKENLLLTSISEQLPAANELTAYPNPFQDQISLKGELWESNQLASIYLWNTNGQLIAVMPVDAQQQPQLPVDLPKGTYYLDGRDKVGQQLQLLTIVKQ